MSKDIMRLENKRENINKWLAENDSNTPEWANNVRERHIVESRIMHKYAMQKFSQTRNTVVRLKSISYQLTGM